MSFGHDIRSQAVNDRRTRAHRVAALLSDTLRHAPAIAFAAAAAVGALPDAVAMSYAHAQSRAEGQW